VLELDVIIDVWARRGLKKKMEWGRKMGAQPVICDRRNNGLFWTISEDLRREKGEVF
jgi:hypothetical protein